LNLLTPTSGTITVDGLSLSLIPRPILRQRYFIAVPQDPFIFPTASLRFNLDPYNALPDTVLVTTLAKTQLWKHISRNNPTEEIEGILDQSISSLPPLSTGQLQLLSLARAILRRQAPLPQHFQDTPVRTKPILLLDEATSSLDLETEALVHDVIQEEFTDRGHTVIVVAHRMGAVVRGMRKGVDAVVRMAGGKIQWIGGVEEMAGDVSGIDMREGSRNGKILGSE
jgi:ATP-binding cassette subfamily C (CFTR/MRP) protein 1